ncbi:uncharacterized protein LOC123966503 [Micropterus dolomieu]|uniref:uncharacterized protein LOC123966503 n=1 Tax=Micropterus dolomieu TaxID=147949 RepID=UPI001E8EACF0|nr:uncharacterized protein LOC123966503 [Micropterus dolomieu]
MTVLGIYLVSGWMDKAKAFRGKVLFLFIATIIFIFFITVRTPRTYRSIPRPHGPLNTCPSRVSEQTITPLNNTKHLLVSAYMDQRVNGFDIRIIGIFRRDSIQPLYCFFCCAGQLSTTTPTTILQHSDNFGFPFVTTDVMCQIPQNCSATHVTLLTQPDKVGFNQIWLPIRNQKTNENQEKNLQFNFTVCISNLFGDHNNVLQFAQTLEMYRLHSLPMHAHPLIPTSIPLHFLRLLPTQPSHNPGFHIPPGLPASTSPFTLASANPPFHLPSARRPSLVSPSLKGNRSYQVLTLTSLSYSCHPQVLPPGRGSSVHRKD